MKIGKRLLAVLLALTMAFSLFPAAFAADFPEVNTWESDMYTDVSSKDWFYENVKAAYEFGLMIGHDDSRFAPEGHITMAQTIAVAARLHSIATTGSEKFEQGSPWYKVYADYALAQGIISSEPDNWAREATRLEFARILVNAMPAEALPAINTVNYGDIPDVADDEAVYTLYRAGILRGNDDTLRFEPDSSIRRSEVAAIVTRMADPELRYKSEAEEPDTPEVTPPKPGHQIIPMPTPTPTPTPEPVGETASSDVTADENGKSAEEVTLEGETIKATVPAGTALEDGAEELTLSVAPMDETTGNITAGEDEEMVSYDVHIEGIAEDNEVAIIVELGAILPIGLNWGNVALYHVEDGATVAMAQVASLSELDAHNEFYYEPATGCVTVALASFSEVAIFVDTTMSWKGERNYAWFTNNPGADEFIIANADQLAGLSAIVGGMDGQTQDSFAGKTIKLISDINLGDDEKNNNSNIIFYPIGYYNSEGTYERTNTAITSGLRNFEGTFDGNGHTISNFYQNTWEMKGDHNWYDATLQYYRDGMGLFGKVYGGTVKNLTVKNFSSDGEITTTGVIAAYADGATFENIAIFDCNPRVYNIGNGGIVGCVGWYAKEAGLKATFKNITVDNSNKISALWGSYDVACGGIVGQYYPTSGQTSAGTPKNAGIEFENCHVSAVMDVYNDVCANYQYYAYRYTGMLIGSVRENETIEGRVYPKMDGITASGCTVHFGTWNDYYYCEIIDNTTASYTHDYQMSRLTEIKAISGTTITYLDGTTGTVPASGRANYVIVDYTKGHGTENATCYHFKDGAVWTHDMGGYHDGTDGGKIIDENGDGNPDLREDKQHIYLEFNNLVTGYGWGVTSKGVGDLAGVTIIDQAADSAVKFEAADNVSSSFESGETVSIGELFKAAVLAEDKRPIKTENVQVFVSPVGDDSTAGATYVANTTDWKQGTLTFSGTGAATITITDYYFCKETVINVTITAIDKFEVAFDHDEGTDGRQNHISDYLYRVGNANTVALGSLFAALDGVTVNSENVSVEITPLDSIAVASGTYTPDATDWTLGTIQFAGTGPVKVVISGDDSTPVTLFLEVVNATNVTTYSSLGNRNSVLLDNITMGTNGTYSLTNATLYGNGFTFDISAGKTGDTADGMIYKNAVINMTDASLDNVVIIGRVYTSYGAGAKDNYNFPAVLTYGECVIANSYISNCSSPIRVRGGTTYVIGTTLSGGNFANIDIRDGKVVLEDVTTINQSNANDKSGDSTVIGLGVVIYPEATRGSVVINGELTQHNYICEADSSDLNTYGQQLVSTMFTDTYSQYQRDVNGTKYVNTGIISMSEDVGESFVVDKRAEHIYAGQSASIASENGYVYSVVAAKDTASIDAPSAYEPFSQYKIKPSYNWNYPAESEFDSSEDALKISFEGESYDLDLNMLVAEKYGMLLGCTVSGDDSITFTETAETEVTFIVSDPYYYLADGTSATVTHEVTLTIKVTKRVPEIKAPSFVFNDQGGTTYTGDSVEFINIDNDEFYVSLKGVTSGANIGTLTTSDGKTVYYPIVSAYNVKDGQWASLQRVYSFFKGVTITDYSDADGTNLRTLDTSTQTIPSELVFMDYDTYGANGSQSGWETSSSGWTFGYDSGEYYSGYYVITGTTNPSSNAGVWYLKYKYVAGNGNTYYYYIGYEFPDSVINIGSCVTPDTLVTLADGTQKEIQYVNAGDELLIWNFYTGEYDVAPASIVFNHGTGVHRVLHLNFADGREVKVIYNHGFFDVEANNFVFIDEHNAESYLGHEFVIQTEDGYSATELVSYYVEEEYTTAYALFSSVHFNCILNGMFTTTPAVVENNFYNPFEIGEGLKYDEAMMQADIEKYGLYTYEDFDHVLTYEQFVVLNIAHLKVAVGKGLVTYDELVELIKTYVPQN